MGISQCALRAPRCGACRRPWSRSGHCPGGRPQPGSRQDAPSGGRLPDLQEFRGRALGGCHLLTACLFRPHGASPLTQEPAVAAPSPLTKEACWQPCFSTRNLPSGSEHAFLHGASHPFSWPVGTDSSRPLCTQMRKPRPTPEPGRFHRRVKLCPGEEGPGLAGQGAAREGLRRKRLVAKGAEWRSGGLGLNSSCSSSTCDIRLAKKLRSLIRVLSCLD